MNNKLKELVKRVYAVVAFIFVAPFLLLRPVVTAIRFFLRTIYSQWKRLEMKKAPSNIVVSYPIELHGGENITCGNSVFLGANGDLSTWKSYMGEHYTPCLEIGDNVTIRANFHISAIGHIKIGNNVLTGNGVTIVDNAHGEVTIDNMKIAPIKRVLKEYRSLIIEDNVWIGDKVTIIGGVTIGTGSIIGANSVVTRDIPPYSVAAGVPAKVIKTLQ